MLLMVTSVSSFFGYGQPAPVAVPVPVPVAEVAVSTTSSAATAAPVTPALIRILPKVVPTAPAIVPARPPEPMPPPMPTPVVVVPPVVTGTVGTTTLAVQSVPLLFGGVAHAGTAVAVSYLQITNIGTEGALLTGFWLTQNGTAPGASVIGLTTVDDTGGSRGSVGGTDGATPFQGGRAFAPTDAYFAPGQTRLFTIKAIMSHNVSVHVGTLLMIDVTSIESSAAVAGTFPIRGTTFTIAQ